MPAVWGGDAPPQLSTRLAPVVLRLWLGQWNSNLSTQISLFGLGLGLGLWL